MGYYSDAKITIAGDPVKVNKILHYNYLAWLTVHYNITE